MFGTVSQQPLRYSFPGSWRINIPNPTPVAFGLTRFVRITGTEQLNKNHGLLPNPTLPSEPPPFAKQNCVAAVSQTLTPMCTKANGEAHRGTGPEEKEKPDTKLLRPGSREMATRSSLWADHPTLHAYFLPSRRRGRLPFVLPPQNLAGVKVETQRKFSGVGIQLLRKDRLPLSP